MSPVNSTLKISLVSVLIKYGGLPMLFCIALEKDFVPFISYFVQII